MRALLVFLALAAPAAALSVEEVVQLTEAGVSDDIILEQMQADGSAFELTAREIVDLQKKKVSPIVLKYMVSTRGKPAKAASHPAAPIPVGAPIKPAEEEHDAVLTVRNVARGIISVLVYHREREIALVQGEIQSATVLFNGSHAELKLPSGLYRVRWANEEPFREMAVAKNIQNELEFRDEEHAWRGVRAVGIIDGQEEPNPYEPKAEPEPLKEELIANPPTRVYTSPTNSNVVVIRDIPQVPVRLTVVPRASCYEGSCDAYSWDDDAGYVWRPSYGVHGGVYNHGGYGFSWNSPSCHRDSWGHGSNGYHGGHSWDSHGGHHYNRAADNIQYYLNWPFGHRHR